MSFQHAKHYLRRNSAKRRSMEEVEKQIPGHSFFFFKHPKDSKVELITVSNQLKKLAESGGLL